MTFESDELNRGEIAEGMKAALSDVWTDFATEEAFQLTYHLLQFPHGRILRILEEVTEVHNAIQRRVTYEYDSPGIAHFFPALILPLGRLIDTIHIEQESRVLPLTLTKPESMSLSYLLLDAEVGRLLPTRDAAAPLSDQLRNIGASEADQILLPLVPEIARQNREDLAGLFAGLSRLRLLTRATEARATGELGLTAYFLRDDNVWRLLRTLMSHRVVYVPVSANTVSDTSSTARAVRQKVTVTYEHDTSAAIGSLRSKVRTLFGHSSDDYLVQAQGFGRSSSYHFRMRGRSDDFVRKVELLTPRVGFFRNSWHRPDMRELGQVAPSELTISKTDGFVENLVHVHVSSDSVPIDDLGDARRYYVRAEFRERPVGHLGLTIARLVIALLITSGIGIAAPHLVDSSKTIGVPLTVFFAVPSLIGLTQGFRPSGYVVCNLATYGTVVISILCGMLYLTWAVQQDMPSDWWGTRALYLGAVVTMSVWLLWVVVLLLDSVRSYRGRKLPT